MSFTTACAEGFECFAFIFVPYSHYDEPKTLSYFTKPAWLLNADGGQGEVGQSFAERNDAQLEAAVATAATCFESWRQGLACGFYFAPLVCVPIIWPPVVHAGLLVASMLHGERPLC